MALQDHIHLDGYTYSILFGGYSPWIDKGERNTLTISGKDDTVYPANAQEGWDMVIRAPHAAVATAGGLDSLKTTWLKTTTVSFTDSLDASYTVLCLGSLRQDSLTPILDGAQNVYHIPVSLKVRQ
jgi:hypothetical protein